MTRPGIEPRSSGPLANTLHIRPIKFYQNCVGHIQIACWTLVVILTTFFAVSEVSVTKMIKSDKLLGFFSSHMEFFNCIFIIHKIQIILLGWITAQSIKYLSKLVNYYSFNITQSAWAVKYTDRRHPHLNEFPRYDTKQSDSEVPVMLEFWGMRSNPSLPSLPGPLWSGVVAPDGVLFYGQIELKYVLMLN